MKSDLSRFVSMIGRLPAPVHSNGMPILHGITGKKLSTAVISLGSLTRHDLGLSGRDMVPHVEVKVRQRQRILITYCSVCNPSQSQEMQTVSSQLPWNSKS
jgi:hypothetical protein